MTELLSGGDGFDILGALEFSAAFAAVVLALKGLGLLWHPSPSKQRFGGAHQVGERSGDRSRQPP